MVTDQFLDSLKEFRAAQTRHDRMVSPKPDTEHIPILQVEPNPYPLRIAYSLFFCSQLLRHFIAALRRNSAALMPSTFPFSLVSVTLLGFFYFTLRNERVGDGLQKNLMWLFVGHSCICTGISIRELATMSNDSSVSSKMEFDNIFIRLTIIFGAIHNFVGALVGIVALNVSDTILTKG